MSISKLTRVLTVGAMLAATNLAGLTAVAHAQANDPDGKDARASLGVLVVTLGLAGGLAVRAARRTRRRARLEHAA